MRCGMRILFVHERLGALGGAESNAQITAAALALASGLGGARAVQGIRAAG